ncbi:MAG TPA: LysR family transcriptional regulator [Burkholderiaceae bacterium]|nr:LysR family transcriptional regulator [Burkholderiaceae bacterium]
MEILVKVADAGTFAKAARLLLITPSAVSHAIAHLEQALGVVLFYRTTRQLKLSTEGVTVLSHAREMIATMARIEAVATGQRDRVAGPLKLGVPSGVASHIVMPALPRFNELYPDVRIEMASSGQVADMHVSGADLNFRIGPLSDTGLVARPLGRLKFGVYASPGYLNRHGTPQHPSELTAHRTLVHKPPISVTIAPWDQWAFERGDERGTVHVGHHLVTDDREALLRGALAGAGLATTVRATAASLSAWWTSTAGRFAGPIATTAR